MSKKERDMGSVKFGYCWGKGTVCMYMYRTEGTQIKYNNGFMLDKDTIITINMLFLKFYL